MFRKRVPERLKAFIGKNEIKFSLRTRDPAVARILNLEAAARLAREWSGIDGIVIDADGRLAVLVQCKAAPAATSIVSIEGARTVVPMSVDAAAASTPPVAATNGKPVPLRSLFGSYAKKPISRPRPSSAGRPSSGA